MNYACQKHEDRGKRRPEMTPWEQEQADLVTCERFN